MTSLTQTTWTGSPVPVGDNLLVLDLDDCLAMTNKPLGDYMAEIIAKEYGMPFDETLEMLWDAFLKYGCSATYLAERDGHDREWIERIYLNAGMALVHNAGQHIAPNPDLSILLETLESDGWSIAVLTQGRREYALGMLEFLEVRQYVIDDLLLGRQCVEFESKKTYAPYARFEERLANQPKRKIMAEDSPSNLVPLLDKNWETALIGSRESEYTFHYNMPQITSLLWNLAAEA